MLRNNSSEHAGAVRNGVSDCSVRVQATSRLCHNTKPRITQIHIPSVPLSLPVTLNRFNAAAKRADARRGQYCRAALSRPRSCDYHHRRRCPPHPHRPQRPHPLIAAMPDSPALATAGPAPPVESAAQQQARLRRERRAAKLQAGESRLQSITALQGGTHRDVKKDLPGMFEFPVCPACLKRVAKVGVQRSHRPHRPEQRPPTLLRSISPSTTTSRKPSLVCLRHSLSMGTPLLNLFLRACRTKTRIPSCK